MKLTERGGGLSEIKGEYWMYEIGKTEDNPDGKRLTVVINPKNKNCVTDFRTYSNSVIKMRANPQGFSYRAKC